MNNHSFTNFKTLDQLFPAKNKIFLLGKPNYGVMGEVRHQVELVFVCFYLCVQYFATDRFSIMVILFLILPQYVQATVSCHTFCPHHAYRLHWFQTSSLLGFTFKIFCTICCSPPYPLHRPGSSLLHLSPQALNPRFSNLYPSSSHVRTISVNFMAATTISSLSFFTRFCF